MTGRRIKFNARVLHGVYEVKAYCVQGMVAADPTAKWMMQAWLFYDKSDFWQAPQAQVLFPTTCSLPRTCKPPASTTAGQDELPAMGNALGTGR